ncbi:MAG TPA: PQQ-binding-like beta-propeller repeat protein [Chthoniobacteraceae bacterium]|nr:PQQ-binding-like beta-propeller repeat protein [Chthoniobacteraceae bacterium]
MKTFAPWKLAAASLVFALAAHAENWPQWRGPNFNGTTPETGLPATWTKDSAKWAAPLPGPSGATPAVWGDSIFVSSPDAEKNLLLLCINRKDGSVRWKKQVSTGDITKGKGNMASPSPITDGKLVWALFGNGDLAALDFDGKLVWQRHLGEEYGRFSINWIYGSSPLLFQNRLYLQVLQRNPAPPDYPGLAGGSPERESYLLALDPKTGKNLWKVARPSDAKLESQESYATPVPHIGPDGKAQILIAGGNCLTGHDPATGKELWRGYGLNTKDGEWMRLVASPVSAGGIAIAAGPKKEPLLAFRTDGKGDVTATGLAWKFDERHTPDVCTPTFYQGKLFILDGDSRTLTCLDPKTGDKKWQGTLETRMVIRSSPVAADGKLYAIDENGTVFVCGTGDEFKVLATIPMGDANGTRASIAISNGQLFIRTTEKLYCIGK